MCSGGRGSPWRTPTSNRAPRRGKRIRNDGATADHTLNPSPAGALSGAPRRPSSAPRPAAAPGVGSGISLRPRSARRPLRRGPALPALRPTGRLFVLLGVPSGASHKGGRLSGGDVGDVMRASTQRLPSRGALLRRPELGKTAGAPQGLLLPTPADPRPHLHLRPAPSTWSCGYLIGEGAGTRGTGHNAPSPPQTPLRWIWWTHTMQQECARMDPARMDPGTQPLLGSGVHCSYTTTDTDVCVCVCVCSVTRHTHPPPPACVHSRWTDAPDQAH